MFKEIQESETRKVTLIIYVVLLPGRERERSRKRDTESKRITFFFFFKFFNLFWIVKIWKFLFLFPFLLLPLSSTRHVFFLLIVRLGDVSELLLDRFAVDVDETEGSGRRGRQSTPLERIPTGRSAPHRVQARFLNLRHGLLNGVETLQESTVRLGKSDVQQFSVVAFVLDQFKIHRIWSVKNHFEMCSFFFF